MIFLLVVAGNTSDVKTVYTQEKRCQGFVIKFWRKK